MYKILGADQKEYGPVSADQLRQWITEGRANAQTMVLAEGSTEWKALGSLPEFAVALTGGRVATPQPVSTPRTNGMALTSLIMGILAITIGFCCCYGLPFNLFGVIFSLIAFAQIKADPQNQGGRGLALTGLILSIASFVIGGIMFVIFVAMGGLQEALRDFNRF
jgi:hypothetical protein